MTEFAPDELFLKDRPQVETALGALAYTSINPDAQQRLQTFLAVHTKLSAGEAPGTLTVYLQGETAAQDKADILASLDALRESETTPDAAKVAATALREIL